MSTPPPLPPKKEVAVALLEGPGAFVHLDPRSDQVVVPKWLKNQAQLVLQIGLNLAVRIPDLEVGDEGISCTLSFNRSPFWCYMPWSAVYALVGEDGRGMIWPEDVPPELASAHKKPSLKVVSSPLSAGESKARSDRLPDSVSGDAAPAGQSPVSVVPDDKEVEETETAPSLSLAPPPEEATEIPDDDATDASSEAPEKKKRDLPPYLRVIK